MEKHPSIPDAMMDAILRRLAVAPCSAYELLLALGTQSFTPLGGEFAIYPVLYRLRARRLVRSKLIETPGEPAYRREYRLTAKACQKIGVAPPSVSWQQMEIHLAEGMESAPPLGAKAQLDLATLPPPVHETVQKLIKQTRLHRREKSNVTADLIAHLYEAQAAGRTMAETAGQIDVPSLAPWITRERRRERSWIEHGAVLSAKAAVVMFVFYLFSIGWFSFKKPVVSIDYGAQINAVAKSAPRDQCAWPIYCEAWSSNGGQFIALDEFKIAGRRPQRMPHPGEPGWDDARRLLTKYSALLDAIRRGGQMPFLGLEVKHGGRYDTKDVVGLDWKKNYSVFDEPAVYDPHGATGWIGLVNERHHSSLRVMARLLLVDLDAAAEAKDAARAIANYRAVLGIARQLKEFPTTIMHLIAWSVAANAQATIQRVIQRQPDLFSRTELTQLQTITSESAGLISFDPSGEVAIFRDLFQRVYSDDGSGKGRICSTGVELFLGFNDMLVGAGQGVEAGNVTKAIVVKMATPFAALGTISRAEAVAELEQMYLDKGAHLPLWELLKGTDPAMQRTQWKSLYRFPLILADDSYERVIIASRSAGALFETTAAAFALELFRRDHGKYPDSTTELSPRYLANAPVDHSTGEPLLLTLREGTPVLYGRGRDGKDNGGVSPPHWTGAALPQTLDWVLYPVPEEGLFLPDDDER